MTSGSINICFTFTKIIYLFYYLLFVVTKTIVTKTVRRFDGFHDIPVMTGLIVIHIILFIHFFHLHHVASKKGDQNRQTAVVIMLSTCLVIHC